MNNNDNILFQMVIEEIFTITELGVVVCGKGNRDTLRLYYPVKIIGKNGIKNSIIRGIEMTRPPIPNRVGILLKDIKKSEIEIGDILQVINKDDQS